MSGTSGSLSLTILYIDTIWHQPIHFALDPSPHNLKAKPQDRVPSLGKQHLPHPPVGNFPGPPHPPRCKLGNMERNTVVSDMEANDADQGKVPQAGSAQGGADVPSGALQVSANCCLILAGLN